eukprot:227041-Pyramimonas_sp.AAC.1
MGRCGLQRATPRACARAHEADRARASASARVGWRARATSARAGERARGLVVGAPWLVTRTLAGYSLGSGFVFERAVSFFCCKPMNATRVNCARIGIARDAAWRHSFNAVGVVLTRKPNGGNLN